MYLLHIATLLILGGTRERTATPLSACHILVMIHHALCYIHTAVHTIEYMYVAFSGVQLFNKYIKNSIN